MNQSTPAANFTLNFLIINVTIQVICNAFIRAWREKIYRDTDLAVSVGFSNLASLLFTPSTLLHCCTPLWSIVATDLFEPSRTWLMNAVSTADFTSNICCAKLSDDAYMHWTFFLHISSYLPSILFYTNQLKPARQCGQVHNIRDKTRQR